MKKWKLAAVMMLCLFLATATFNKVQMPVYAYTEEEIAAAKAWLSANGYSPTRAGAEQAYQDYLNGKWGPVGGDDESETPAVPETEVMPTQELMEKSAELETPIVKYAETTVEETTETLTEETTALEEDTMTESSLEEESISDEVSEETTSDIMEETGTDMESSSEEGESFIHVGKYDGIIVVIAIAACAVMGYVTYRYVKKGKKDGE